MRLRRNSNATNQLSQSSIVVLNEHVDEDINRYKGKWNEVFENDHPIHIEVGMGKGRFITLNAKMNPNINYIGIEKYETVAAIALKKATEEQLPNLRILCVDANQLNDIFEDGEISAIYLNFSDPWPKAKHEKRRLTYQDFLTRYQKILNKEGQLKIKTDNRSLFEYTLWSINQYGMNLEDVTLDLHQSSGYEDNIETEYEQKFMALGQPIYRLVATFKEVDK